MIKISPDRCYDIEIVFDRHVYSNADFYSFPLSKEVLRPKGHGPKTNEEKVKQATRIKGKVVGVFYMCYAVLEKQNII